MTTYGITEEGFVTKDLETILEEINSDCRQLLGADIVTEADSVLGQINGIMADKLAESWEVMQATYRSNHPDYNTGESQDNTGAITGALRLSAKESSVTLYLLLENGAEVDAGSIVSIGSTGERWETIDGISNSLGYTAVLEVAAQSVEKGPIAGSVYSIDTIVTPIDGWSGRASLRGVAPGNFHLTEFQTLIIEVDEGDPQTIIFALEDFADITAATAAEVVSVISDSIDGIAAEVIAGAYIRIESTTEGTGSAVRIVGGTAASTLGLTAMQSKGFNPAFPAQLQNGSSGPFDMSTAPSLFVEIDEASFQTVIFQPAFFGDKSVGSIENGDGGTFLEGETFTIYGVEFEFTKNANGNALNPVIFTGTESVSQMGDKIRAAINDSSFIDISATAGLSGGTTILQNNTAGVIGNGLITETVVSSTFEVEGMRGGVDGTPATASAREVARAINEQLTGARAFVFNNQIVLESLTVGLNSYVEVTGGTANEFLTFPSNDKRKGTSGSATLGRDDESHEAFRLRRSQLTRVTGSGALEALRAALLNVDGVQQAFVYENDTGETDASGRRPSEFECVVQGGDSVDIAKTIFLKKPLGGTPYRAPGDEGVTVGVSDTQGTVRPIKFSRPIETRFYVTVDIEAIRGVFGAGVEINGQQEVRDSIKDVGDSLSIGTDIKNLRFGCAPLSVAGVHDVTKIAIGIEENPTDEGNISISDRTLATFASEDIVVNVTYVVAS